jgi:hypothetical protein
MTAPRALLSFLVLVVSSSCAEPLQNGGVVMSPNAAARLEVMCRYRATDAQKVCVEAPEEE